MTIAFDTINMEFIVTLFGKMSHKASLGQDANGIITRIDNAINSIEKRIGICNDVLKNLEQQISNAEEEIKQPFVREEELNEKLKRLDELNAKLNLDKKENELVDSEPEGEKSDEAFVYTSERDEIDER